MSMTLATVSCPALLTLRYQSSLADFDTYLSCTFTRTSIYSLPDDLLLLIISYVELKDILALRKTSKRFYSMTKLRWVWYDAMKRHVIAKGLPVPAADVDLRVFSAEHLEARAVHAAKFHDNWCSPQPKPRHSIEFHAERCLPDELPQDLKTTVKHVFFLPGRNGEFLVTVVGRVITCWEVPLDGSGAYRVAEWVSSSRVEQAVVNEDPKNEAVLTFVSEVSTGPGEVELTTLSLDKFHGHFTVRNRIRGHRNSVLPLHVMDGDYVIFGDPLVVWFRTSPLDVQIIPEREVYPLVGDESNKVLVVKPINRYMLIVREREYQLVYSPIWNGKRTVYGPAKDISACVLTQFPAKDAVIIARSSAAASGDDEVEWPNELVTILIRCSEDGLDTIQQFDLLPAPQSKTVQTEPSEPKEVFRVPCVFPTGSTRVLVVPPSCCKLNAGSSGKGYWIQTWNVTSRHSEYPARCLMGFHLSSEGEGKDDAIKLQYGQPGSDLNLCQGTLYSRRCDMSEIIWKKYMIVSTALEDTVGRLAIGDRTGKVEVVDFV
ncbi:hypothetical protein BKA93DRAFT_801705 [Sparassis latifolia]|uniref:F-box domain-containing protein n=1 Tax=Sparassis crispa TaxID=139825 RepID=A0A401GEN7_9APHY|nr:predicted protein [Sparassis crispa]GBE80654.1 predicted protein [Sparassis crispa]